MSEFDINEWASAFEISEETIAALATYGFGKDFIMYPPYFLNI